MNQLREFLPPALLRILHRSWLKKHGWFGNFHSWEDAEKATVGYDSAVIVEKVKNALLKVKNGEAAFERDSVLFKNIEYNWPIVAALTWVAAQNDGRLNLLDFWGSLGSLFYQNKTFLTSLKSVQWNVVEQENFVVTGKQFFQDEQLKFYYSVEECLKENTVDLILLSSVLPYIKEPYAVLSQFKDFKFVVIDKMPFIDSETDRLTIQKVPKDIYQASYPAWFFSEKKFMAFISSDFDIIADFQTDIMANFPAVFKGFILTKKIKK